MLWSQKGKRCTQKDSVDILAEIHNSLQLKYSNPLYQKARIQELEIDDFNVDLDSESSDCSDSVSEISYN